MNGGREGIVHEDSQVLNNACDPAIHADNPLCITLAEKREDSFEELAYNRPRHPSSERGIRPTIQVPSQWLGPLTSRVARRWTLSSWFISALSVGALASIAYSR